MLRVVIAQARRTTWSANRSDQSTSADLNAGSVSIFDSATADRSAFSFKFTSLSMCVLRFSSAGANCLIFLTYTDMIYSSILTLAAFFSARLCLTLYKELLADFQIVQWAKANCVYLIQSQTQALNAVSLSHCVWNTALQLPSFLNRRIWENRKTEGRIFRHFSIFSNFLTFRYFRIDF